MNIFFKLPALLVFHKSQDGNPAPDRGFSKFSSVPASNGNDYQKIYRDKVRPACKTDNLTAIYEPII
jgi:hypothetical protein